MPRLVIAAYRPKPGQRDALLALVREHVPTLRRLGLATGRPGLAMRAADGTVLEVFEWVSREAIARAHHDPEVQVLWSKFGAVCDYMSLDSVAEARQLFAEFEPIDLQ
jgi:hypothetical protein